MIKTSIFYSLQTFFHRLSQWFTFTQANRQSELIKKGSVFSITVTLQFLEQTGGENNGFMVNTLAFGFILRIYKPILGAF